MVDLNGWIISGGSAGSTVAWRAPGMWRRIPPCERHRAGCRRPSASTWFYQPGLHRPFTDQTDCERADEAGCVKSEAWL